MALNKKGFSLFDVILVLIIVGIVSYFAILHYYKWAEKFMVQEAVDHLKIVKNQVELCFYTKSNTADINNCMINPNIQNANTLHFKCCEVENNTKENTKVEYAIFAIRNDRGLTIVDDGGERPACSEDNKPQHHSSSGAVLCRHVDGTFNIEGWGIYKGIYI